MPRVSRAEQPRCTSVRSTKPSPRAQQSRPTSLKATTRSVLKQVSALEEDLGADALARSSWACPAPPPTPPPTHPSLSRSSSDKRRPNVTMKVMSASLSTTRPHSLMTARTAQSNRQLNLPSLSLRAGQPIKLHQVIPLPPSSMTTRLSKSDACHAVRGKSWSFEQHIDTGQIFTERGTMNFSRPLPERQSVTPRL